MVSRTSNTAVGKSVLKISLNNSLSLAATTSYHSYAIVFQYILCSLSHIACKHQTDATLCENGGNTGFAATTLRCGKGFNTYNSLILNRINGKLFAMTKVVIYHTASCW